MKFASWWIITRRDARRQLIRLCTGIDRRRNCRLRLSHGGLVLLAVLIDIHVSRVITPIIIRNILIFLVSNNWET